MKGILLAISMMFASAVFAADGPFGLAAGMTQEQIMAAVGAGGIYSIEGTEIILLEPPQPHPQFNSYHLTVSPKSGLVRVTAFTKPIRESGYATETRSRYDALKAALTEKYGRPIEDLDLVMPDSIWRDGQHYLESITFGDRLVKVAWAPNERGIAGVILRTIAYDRLNGGVTIDYRLDGYVEYEAQKKVVDGGAL